MKTALKSLVVVCAMMAACEPTDGLDGQTTSPEAARSEVVTVEGDRMPVRTALGARRALPALDLRGAIARRGLERADLVADEAPAVRSFLDGAVQLEGDTLTIGNPAGGAGLTLRGDFAVGDGELSVSGDVAIETAVGDVTLSEASLLVRLQPFEIVGRARVPFPSLGFLDGAVEGEAPFAELALAHGSTLETIEVNGQEMTLDPDMYYFLIDYSTGVSAEMGDVSLSTPGGGSTLVLAPEEPMFFVGGDLAGLITGGLVDDAAFGFSLAGRIPFTPALPLWDGREWREDWRIDGHVYAQGTVQMGNLPISVGGDLMIDADADDDGRTIFEGDRRDVTMAGDSQVSLGYDKAGFSLSLELARASWVFAGREGAIGGFYFHTNTSADANLGELLADTPLGFLETRGSEVDCYGLFRDVDDFFIHWQADVRVLGFDLANATIELGDDGVSLHGWLQPLPFTDSQVEVSGQIKADGTFELTGRAQLEVAGVELSRGHLTLGRDGVSLSARAEYAGTGFDVRGGAWRDGRFLMSGSVRANAGPLSGRVGLTVSERGVEAGFSGRACMVVPIGEACHQECSDWGIFDWMCEGWNTVCEVVSEERCMDTAGSVNSDGVACVPTPIGPQCVDIL